jgi:hypothetical protein
MNDNQCYLLQFSAAGGCIVGIAGSCIVGLPLVVIQQLKLLNLGDFGKTLFW